MKKINAIVTVCIFTLTCMANLAANNSRLMPSTDIKKALKTSAFELSNFKKVTHDHLKFDNAFAKRFNPALLPLSTMSECYLMPDAADALMNVLDSLNDTKLIAKVCVMEQSSIKVNDDFKTINPNFDFDQLSYNYFDKGLTIELEEADEHFNTKDANVYGVFKREFKSSNIADALKTQGFIQDSLIPWRFHFKG